MPLVDIANGVAAVAVLVGWVMVFWAIVTRRRTGFTGARRRDHAAIFGLLLQGVAFSLVFFRHREPITAAVVDALWLQIFLDLLAVASSFVSALVVVRAIRHLGRQWSLSARVLEGHTLLTDGPFRFTRNPIYLGMMGLLFATGLTISTGPMIGATLLLYYLGTLIRVQGEERILQEEFGAVWQDYAGRVPRLFPDVWRRR